MWNSQDFSREGAQNKQGKHPTLRPLELSSCPSIKDIDEVSQLTDSPVIEKEFRTEKQHFKDVASDTSILDIFNLSDWKELKNFQDHSM
jgi:hypothetical protein